jgi:hypothetical protein
MSRRTSSLTRAPAQQWEPDSLPDARNVILPELIGGLSGAPLKFARWFHRFIFEQAESAVKDECCLVLQHVVIGQPGPRLREIQLWGSEVDPVELARVSSEQLAAEFGLGSDQGELICTRTLASGGFQSAPSLGDRELEVRTLVRLMISTTSTLACIAPYVRVGDGVVWPYRPSNMLTLLGRT